MGAMEWKELVMYVLGLEKDRQKLLSKVAGLEKRKLTLEDRLDELVSSRPWEDKSRNVLSRVWSWTFASRFPEQQTKEWLDTAKSQLNSAQNELRSLEADFIHEARQYIQENPGFDQAYDAARQQLSYLNHLTYRLASLHKYAEEALKGVTHAKRDYDYSHTTSYDPDWWLKWGRGYLRGAKKDVEAFAHYDGLVEDISAYLPEEAQALENGIKLARMLDLNHMERLSKAIAHLKGFEKTVTKAKKGLNTVHTKYRQIKQRQIGYLIKRIRDGAF